MQITEKEQLETEQDVQIKQDVQTEQGEKLAVPLINADEVKNKGPYVKKPPFGKYEEAVSNTDIVDWIKQKIGESKDGMIRVKFVDIVRELGPGFENRSSSSMYMGLNYVLCKRGLVLNTGTTWDNEKIFVIRLIKEGEVLPKYVRDLMKKEENYEKIYKAKEVIRKVKLEEIKKEKEDARKRKTISRKERRNNFEEFKNEKESCVDTIQAEEEEEMKEVMELRRALHGIDGKTYMIEVYEFKWNTLSWKLIKGRSVKSDSDLLRVIKENTSKPDIRIRLEITAVTDVDNIKTETDTDDKLTTLVNIEAEKDIDNFERIKDAVSAFFNILDVQGK